MAAPSVQARLLDRFEVAVAGRPVTAGAFERPSGLRLLKLLLATPGHRLRREEAADLLWPEADPDRSSANLRKAIHFARRALATADPGAETLIATDGDRLRLAEGAHVDIDADELAAAIDAVEGRAASSAGEMGSALDGLARLGGLQLLPDDPYEEWLVPLRERLRQRTLAALDTGADLARGSGDRVRAFALIERSLALDPADEHAHRVAIELRLEAGEIHAARRQLQACRQAVAEAYGVEPDPALAALIDAAAAERPRSAEKARLEAPIVGRRRELGTAEGAFDAVAAGGTSAVLLRGPAGIGKSRILRELAASARVSGWRVIEARGLEEATGGPFAAIAEAVLAMLAGGAGASLATDGLAEPGRSALLVAAPGDAGEPAVEFASDDALQRGLLAAIADTAGGETVAVIVDDAQWLDAASLDLLRAAVAGATGIPIILLAAIRDDPGLLGGPVNRLLDAVAGSGGHEIRLGPLGPREIRALVERDVAEGNIDDAVAEAIAELSAGTPLFAVELFRSARETGLLEQRDGRWSFRRGVTALQVTEGVARLVERRVARLGSAARVILATAAELGDIVAFEDLVATGIAGDDVLDAVDAALAGGIVVEAGGRYAFGHPLYRAGLRRSLPPRGRADIHQRIAMALSRGIDPADLAAVRRAGATGVDLIAIAAHATSAVELGRSSSARIAVGFGLGAGERQAFLFDFGGAVPTLRRALDIWQRLPEPDRAGFAIARAHVELGQALRRLGDDGGAAASFRAAIDAAHSDDDLATAYSAASWLPYEHGRFDAAIALLDEGRARISEPVALARLDSARGWILGRSGQWDTAKPLLAAVVATLEREGPSADLMRALDRLAVATGDTGDEIGAIAILERALHMATELGRTGERAAFEIHLAGSLHAIGRLEEAAAALDRARSLCRLTGERYVESVTEWISAEVEQSRGHDAEAILHRRRELEIFGQIGGNARHEALAHAHIAHLARRLGDRDLERTETESARVGARHSGIDGLKARVEWALTTDDWFAPIPPLA
jgi:DNA-binding SARP family transcriptional activator